jgi:hypothetical protein
MTNWRQRKASADRIIDDIAIERSMEGDRSAFIHLTNREKTVFYDKVNKKSNAFRKTYGLYSNSLANEFDWATNLRENLGVSRQTFDQNLVRARRRAR